MYMKNIKLNIYVSSVCIVLFMLMTVSCGYLDFDETDGRYTREDMYEYFAKTKQMLTNVYSYMPQGFNPIGTAMRDCASDDAEFADVNGNIQLMNNGNWSPINTVDNQFGLYKGVRAANEFIESIKNADFSRFEHNTNYELWKSQLSYFPYEARVLRAYYFFELARRYGDIPMPVTMLSSEEANSIEKTRFDDVISFIVKECDECSVELPITYADQPAKETGRITKGFAMALKSKALLYAASKLHNTDGNKDKWIASAKAALDVIKLTNKDGNPVYMLDKQEAANNLSSKEVVLFRMNTDNSNFELNNFPLRFTNGKKQSLATGNFPTQSLVDAFQTNNGYKVTLEGNEWICEDPSFDSQNPYTSRDKRFERTVLANGMSFKNSVIETLVGGVDDTPVNDGGTPTGYYLRKYIQESTSFQTDNEVKNKHHWVIYRLSEAYLTFAESMIEAYDDPNYVNEEFGSGYTALWAINEVRKNAGMPNVENTPAYKNVLTKDGFVSALRNEWRVEFAFEDHRFWDIRRWMIAGEILNNVDGVKIYSNDNKLSFKRVNYKKRVWNDRMYLYPIPQEELFKNKNLNPQNQGW